MAMVQVEIIIRACPEDTWAAVADVGAVHERLLPGRVESTRIEGDTRILTMPNGAEISELIVAVDHKHRRMAYSAQNTQSLEVRLHHASFQVFPADAPGESRLVWTTDVLPHTLEPQVRARAERGAAEIKHVIEAAHPVATGR